MVQLIGPTPPRYGVIKWIGSIPGLSEAMGYAGVEMVSYVVSCLSCACVHTYVHVHTFIQSGVR